MDFHHGEREFLVANRAITMDNGIERFVGLDLAESLEFLELSRLNDIGSLDADGKARFGELHGKHETERQVYVRGEKSLNAFQKP